MSESDTKQKPTAEEREIEALRQRSETLHISDVEASIRREVRRSLSQSVEATFDLAGVDADVSEVYVYGSFAEGDALADISDLDVRVVVDCEEQTIPDVIRVEEAVRTKLSPEITEDSPFGFVDPKIVRAGSGADEGEVIL